MFGRSDARPRVLEPGPSASTLGRRRPPLPGVDMSENTATEAEVAELLELADEAALIVLEDRVEAAADGRDPLTLWDLLGHCPPALALAELRLERMLA